VEIKTAVHPPELSLTADREQIQMILINLIKNAQEAIFQSEDKVISIQSGIGLDQYKYIQVIDRGPGIPPSSIEAIFVPFYTTKKEGNGIGLAISRQIMNLHKGSLQVQSIPHVATTFTLRF
jgi:signal transduction histidine kinase